MRFMKALSFILMGYVVSGMDATAEELCPAGPFETDVRVIAAAISAQPLRRPVLYAGEAYSDNEPYAENKSTDGAMWTASGGLTNTQGHWLTYDAKRYVAVGTTAEFDSHKARALPPALPGQVIKRRRNGTFVTTVTRPTPQEARKFACLTNRLVAPPNNPILSSDTASNAVTTMPGLLISGTPSDSCSSHGAYNEMGSDEWSGSFELLHNGSILEYDTDIPCVIRSALLYDMEETVDNMIGRAIAQANSTWRAPHIHSLATDTEDNLYFMVDPGTISGRVIELRKMTPSGTAIRLSYPTSEPYFNGSSFAVDARGHAWVVLSNTSADWQFSAVYDVAPDSDPSDVLLTKRPGVADPTGFPSAVDSITVDANNHLYAIGSSQVFEVVPGNPARSLVEIPQRSGGMRSLHQPSYIVAAADGTFFVSNPGSNAIFKVTQDMVVTVFAGIPGRSGAADGPGSTARFNSPKGLVLGHTGTLYVADSGNHTIRRITPEGQVSTFVGKLGRRGVADGQGSAARLDRPASIAMDSGGTLYVANGEDNLVRKVSPDGVVSTLNAQQIVDLQ